MLVRFTCVLTLLAAIAAGATAQEPPAGSGSPEEPKSYSWGVGFAGLTQQQPYKGIDRFNMAIPMLYFENRWVQLMGPRLDVKLPGLKWANDQELSGGVGVHLFGFNGYKPDDAPILEGMKERKNGIFAGPFIKWSSPLMNVTAEWMLDTTGDSEGERVSIGVERSFQVGQHFMFTPSAAATLLDEKYVNYYYGVRASEAREGRPAYAAESTMNVDVGVRTDYMIDQRQSVFLALQFTGLGQEIKDSPLVDRSNETTVLVGYLYRFR